MNSFGDEKEVKIDSSSYHTVGHLAQTQRQANHARELFEK